MALFSDFYFISEIDHFLWRQEQPWQGRSNPQKVCLPSLLGQTILAWLSYKFHKWQENLVWGTQASSPFLSGFWTKTQPWCIHVHVGQGSGPQPPRLPPPPADFLWCSLPVPSPNISRSGHLYRGWLFEKKKLAIFTAPVLRKRWRVLVKLLVRHSKANQKWSLIQYDTNIFSLHC